MIIIANTIQSIYNCDEIKYHRLCLAAIHIRLCDF